VSISIISRAQQLAEETRRDQPQILLFAAEPLGSEAARALRLHLATEVTVTDSQPRCINALRRGSFDLVLLEESALDLDPLGAEAVYEAVGTSVALEVNFGTMRAERIALAAGSALRRRQLDLERAQGAARSALQHELTASVSGLLLESQLALRQAGADAVPALHRLVGLAEHVCAQLRGNSYPPL
jgi:threonine dehydrogenase-like Zn-dependent dehydrogenase